MGGTEQDRRDADDAVRVDLNDMHIDRETAHRWAPIAVALIPRFRELLLARRVSH